jgi:2-keto-4-pentenoate hydratase
MRGKTMTESIDRVAQLFLEARRQGGPLVVPEPEEALAGVADAYAVQERVVRELGPVGAWKVGAASPSAEPVRAPILAATIHRSPAALPAGGFHVIGIEAEIAYRLGTDLPARTRPYTGEEVAAAIEGMLPAIELVDTRLADHAAAPPLWKLADNQINWGLVTGAPATDWRRFDPLTQPVRLEVDGAVVAEGRGGNTAGDPFRLLVWLADHCGSHCGGLRRGQIVTTGSLTGLRFVAPGARVQATLEGLGRVSVTFAP